MFKRSEHGVRREFFICEVLHLLHKFVPAYNLSGIGRFDKISPRPHEDGQEPEEQCLSSASIKFLWLRQIHDPSGLFPALDTALDSSQPFFLSAFSLPLYIFFRWSRSVTTTVNKSQRRQPFALRTFLVKVKKIRKPSVCSTSLHSSKLITVVQFFFRVTPVLQ